MNYNREREIFQGFEVNSVFDSAINFYFPKFNMQMLMRQFMYNALILTIFNIY